MSAPTSNRTEDHFFIPVHHKRACHWALIKVLEQ